MKTVIRTMSLSVFAAALALAMTPDQAGAAAPPVTISFPTNGTILSAPATFTIRASVSGGGNSVTQVEFFANDQSLGIDADNPYRIDVDELAAGAYTLTAILTDNFGDRSTNSIAIIVNALPTVVITAPGDGTGLLAPASFDLRAAATDTDGAVVRIAFARGTTALGTATTNPAGVSIRNLGVGQYRFIATATDNLGGARSTNIDVLVKNRPSIAFTAPLAGARLTAVTNVFTGTASDPHGLASSDYSVNGAPFQSMTGTTQWTVPLTLPPGTNMVRVRAVDSFGNSSLTNLRSVFQVVPSALTLAINGTGTVGGLTNNQMLEINRGYQLTAIPASGHVFSNWTGSLTQGSATLKFLMQSNMMLTANFVPNPFLHSSGSFSGLFHETNEARHGTSGEFNLRLTTAGKYTAILRLAGIRIRMIGSVSLEGRATNVIDRPGLSPLTVTWAVDLHGRDEIIGTVSDGQWLAELRGDRATFHATLNPAPWAARYTLAISPVSLPGSPDGAGWGTLRITTKGLGTLAGALPDGTKLSRKAPLSKNGDWPLYAPLYQLQGSAVGWVHFETNAVLSDLGGSVDWFRPGQPGGLFFPGGFTNQTALAGSRFLPPLSSTNRILALNSGALLLSGGNLSQSWTNTFNLIANNRVTNSGPNTFSLSVNNGSGLFKGSFFDPVVNRSFSFTGALLQKSTNGAGYFLGTNRCGRVAIESRP